MEIIEIIHFLFHYESSNVTMMFPWLSMAPWRFQKGHPACAADAHDFGRRPRHHGTGLCCPGGAAETAGSLVESGACARGLVVLGGFGFPNNGDLW